MSSFVYTINHPIYNKFPSSMRVRKRVYLHLRPHEDDSPFNVSFRYNIIIIIHRPPQPCEYFLRGDIRQQQQTDESFCWQH